MPVGTAVLGGSGAPAAFEAPRPAAGSVSLPGPLGRFVAVSKLKDSEMSGRFARLAPVSVAGLSVIIPVVEIVRLAHTADRRQLLWALAAALCCLPPHFRNVLLAARGRVPSGGWWLFALMAVVVAGAAPLAGIRWLTQFWILAVAALLLLRPPWSYLLAAVVAAVPAPLALALGGNAGQASWPFFALIWRVVLLFIVVWLIGALRRLQEARLAIADRAVAAERRRIDGEVMRTLGGALGSTVSQGRRALDRLPDDPASAAAGLHVLVDGSRRTLAEARQMINGYQRASMRAELDTAISLLTAAGIGTRLVLPRGGLPNGVDEPVRAALRSATAELLGGQRAKSCVIAVTRLSGRLAVEVRAEDEADAADAAIGRVAAR